MSEDPYHTEFVSWRVDHFSFFYFFSTNGGKGGGQALSGKFHYFLFEPLPKEINHLENSNIPQFYVPRFFNHGFLA